jgi:hypothetical protein
MKHCEEIQVEMSALMDGEISSQDTVELFDHILGCAECTVVYHDMRSLEDTIDSLRPAQTLGAPVARMPFAPLWSGWVAAATVLLALGLGWGGIYRGVPSFSPDRPVELTLGESSGDMNDQRFVSMTVELLKADEHYRRTMLEVLDNVVEGRSEASASVFTESLGAERERSRLSVQ